MTLMGQRQRTLLFTEISVARVSAFSYAGSLNFSSHKEGQVTPAHAGLSYRRGTLKLGNQNHLKWVVSMAVLFSRGEHGLYYMGR